MKKFNQFLENKQIETLEKELFLEFSQNEELLKPFEYYYENFFTNMFRKGGQQQAPATQQPVGSQNNPVPLQKAPAYQQPRGSEDNPIPLTKVLQSSTVSNTLNQIANHPQVKQHFAGNRAQILQNVVNSWNAFKGEVKNMQHQNGTRPSNQKPVYLEKPFK